MQFIYILLSQENRTSKPEPSNNKDIHASIDDEIPNADFTRDDFARH